MQNVPQLNMRENLNAPVCLDTQGMDTTASKEIYRVLVIGDAMGSAALINFGQKEC